PHLRALQKALAKDITILVHSEKEYEVALKASGILFGKSSLEDLATLDERTFLQVFDGVDVIEMDQATYKNAESALDLLTLDQTIFKSKGEARKMIQGGGVSINKQKIENPNNKVETTLLQDKYLLVQKGKKNYYIIKVLS
uniref:S4 domain-containing protein n=1 Tax=Cyclobacterium amurskyense TaxID=320787 RepID=UPI0030D985D5